MYLPFISDENLLNIVKKVIDRLDKANNKANENLHRNVIDPFSALFESLYKSKNYKNWLEMEKSRQINKSFQNSVGEFHQDILGSMHGWKNLGTGEIVDIVNHDRKIVAEIKNKYNTTKGNHKVAIYDDLKKVTTSNFSGYVGYYVEVIPNNKKEYNKPFIPPDNTKKGTNRTKNDSIRIIDGKSFYTLASETEGALEKLYSTLPVVIGQVLGVTLDEEIYADFRKLLTTAYEL